MHYFSLHTQQDEHIGFLIMYPHDDSQNQSGDLAIKLLDSLPTRLREATKLLADWQVQAALSWEESWCLMTMATHAAQSAKSSYTSATTFLF